MKIVALSKLAHLVMGQSPPSSTYNTDGEGLPFFQGKMDFGDLYPTPRVFCSSPIRIAEPGDILISVRAPVGPTNINRIRSCIGRGLAAIRCTDEIDGRYLLYFLRFYEPELSHDGRGSTFDAIGRSDLEAISLPFPSLYEQQRIAKILTYADRQRRLARYAIEIGDTYLQSVFLKMFAGEEAQKWPRKKVEAIAKKKKNAIRTGPFGSQLLHSEFTQDTTGIAVLGIDNAVQNRFVWNNNRFISEEKYQQLLRYTVFPQDVIITIMGTCGKCAIVPNNFRPAITTKHLCCITLDQHLCLPIYLKSSFLMHPSALRQLGVSERGAVMPGLNMGIIKGLELPIPPIELQAKYAQVVRKFDRIQAQQREFVHQTEHLFQTLLHQAFQGKMWEKTRA